MGKKKKNIFCLDIFLNIPYKSEALRTWVIYWTDIITKFCNIRYTISKVDKKMNTWKWVEK